jgi:hypothetical protein
MSNKRQPTVVPEIPMLEYGLGYAQGVIDEHKTADAYYKNVMAPAWGALYKTAARVSAALGAIQAIVQVRQNFSPLDTFIEVLKPLADELAKNSRAWKTAAIEAGWSQESMTAPLGYISDVQDAIDKALDRDNPDGGAQLAYLYRDNQIEAFTEWQDKLDRGGRPHFEVYDRIGIVIYELKTANAHALWREIANSAIEVLKKRGDSEAAKVIELVEYDHRPNFAKNQHKRWRKKVGKTRGVKRG